MSKLAVMTQTVKRLALRTWRETNEDNIFGAAAELGYYFLLALFPMLIFMTSLVGFIPDLQNIIIADMTRIVPRDAIPVFSETLSDVTRHSGGGLLSLGLLGALWAAS